MATMDPQGVIFLDADGSDEVKNYPALQRSNASKLSRLLLLTYGGFTINNSFPETYGKFYRAGRIATLTMLFKTGDFTQQPEIFPKKLAGPSAYPKATLYSTLNGATNDGRPVVIIVKLTTDGILTRLEETPLVQNSTYAGTLTWVTGPIPDSDLS